MLRDLYHVAGALFPEGQAAADPLASDLQIALLPNLKVVRRHLKSGLPARVWLKAPFIRRDQPV